MGITVACGATPETSVLLPLAAAWLIHLVGTGQASFLAGSTAPDILLIVAGPLTVVPLVCFAVAARKLTLTIIGFMPFIAPTLQFLVGVAYGEVLTTAAVVCFVFIWTAVGLFSFDGVRANRRAVRAG